MKLRVVFAVVSIAAVLAALPARADEHGKRGDYDEHHGWHDADWWHDHHPGWLWQHHPEWAEHHREWRLKDGDWDDHHNWRDRDWWFDQHPQWVKKHHPHWKPWHDDWEDHHHGHGD